MKIPDILFLEANRVWRTYQVDEGSKFFIPYQTGPVVFDSDGAMEIIATFPPDIKMNSLNI